MARTEWSARDRIVYSAAQLIRTQGVSATGLREIVAHAKAPRGSLQHYFPGGKEQLVREALNWAGEFAGGRIAHFMARLDPPTPAGLFTAMVDQWRTEFAAKGFDRGCPLVAATADTAAASESLRQVASAAFADWQQPVGAALVTMGVPQARADSLALLMISALEGAIVLARAHRDAGPLDAVVAELGPLLDEAARPL
ncbi:TetR/AcrR family transcriptional regulator [Amycolatopsis taiwanensis]|uniref:TetR/AcrR family transcriptional regulator n=1 Tax=Amycolatopsis taiwanensis TaxID=342230 RepID=UPI000489718C|nr:TetR/AcrR family transcriptional regulator [Amycolatopsis taiwanensis]